jgi:hypothetical protein
MRTFPMDCPDQARYVQGIRQKVKLPLLRRPTMPMELLSRLCDATMPCYVSDEDEIEKLSVLRAAQLVEAEIPPMLEDGGLRWFSGPAVVHRVSRHGFAAVSGHEAGRVAGRCRDPQTEAASSF